MRPDGCQWEILANTGRLNSPHLILRSELARVSKDGPLAPEFAADPSRQRCALPQDEVVKEETPGCEATLAHHSFPLEYFLSSVREAQVSKMRPDGCQWEILANTGRLNSPHLILRSELARVSKDGPLAPEFAADPSRQRCALPQDEDVGRDGPVVDIP
ncbi:hypothetical protein [Roseibium sp. M-1]